MNIDLIADGCIAGGAAGVVVETALYPIDTIKTRLQVKTFYSNPSVYVCLVRVGGKEELGSQSEIIKFMVCYTRGNMYCWSENAVCIVVWLPNVSSCQRSDSVNVIIVT